MESNSKSDSVERNSDSNSNSNYGNSNSIPIQILAIPIQFQFRSDWEKPIQFQFQFRNWNWNWQAIPIPDRNWPQLWIKPFYTKHANNFKIAHININSIRNKFEPFREVLIENIFDVLSIQESKLDESFPAINAIEKTTKITMGG